MFKKLRNKFVLINLATTTAVLVIAFSAIYAVVANDLNHRAMPRRQITITTEIEGVKIDENEFNAELEERIQEERKNSLNTLLLALVITGLGVEIAVAALSFYLAEQSIKPVKETYDAHKDFIANASHEIKTPLAVIQANLEAADIQDNPWIDNITIKTEELTSLNNQLLSLARLESTEQEIKLEKTNLGVFVKETIQPLKPQLAQKNIKLTIKSAKNLKPLNLNQPAVKQILNILLDNAQKYCDKKIVVNLAQNQISIKNDGTTISADKLPHIFERFYQTDKTKNGVGLGLAIAKQLADKNHYKLTAASDKTSTTFTLEF